MNKDVKIFKLIGTMIIAIGCVGMIMSWLVCDLQGNMVIIIDILFGMVAFIGLLIYESMERLENKRRVRTWQLKRHSKIR